MLRVAGVKRNSDSRRGRGARILADMNAVCAGGIAFARRCATKSRDQGDDTSCMSSDPSQSAESARALTGRGVVIILSAVACAVVCSFNVCSALLGAQHANDVGAARPLLALTLLAGSSATPQLADDQRKELEAIVEQNAGIRWLALLAPDGSGPEVRDERVGASRGELVRSVDLNATAATRKPAPFLSALDGPLDIWTIPLRGRGGVLAAALDARPAESDPGAAVAAWILAGVVGVILCAVAFRRIVVRPLVLFQDRVRLLRSELRDLAVVSGGSELAVTLDTLTAIAEELHSLRTESRMLRHTMHNRVEAQAERAARAVQRAERDAELDPLTRVKSRRVLEREFPRLFAQQQAAGVELSVALVDLDNFKVLNDTLGHHRGDELLSAVGDLLRACARRAADVVTRYGGDEFVVLMPQTSPIEALAIMRRFLELLGERLRAFPPTHPRAGASIGIAAMNANEAESCEELLQMADRAMYEAKRGDARILLYVPTMRGAGR